MRLEILSGQLWIRMVPLGCRNVRATGRELSSTEHPLGLPMVMSCLTSSCGYFRSFSPQPLSCPLWPFHVSPQKLTKALRVSCHGDSMNLLAMPEGGLWCVVGTELCGLCWSRICTPIEIPENPLSGKTCTVSEAQTSSRPQFSSIESFISALFALHIC